MNVHLIIILWNIWKIVGIVVGCVLAAVIIAAAVFYLVRTKKGDGEDVKPEKPAKPEKPVKQEKPAKPEPVKQAEIPAATLAEEVAPISKLFTLSRADVLDHADDMSNYTVRFPVKVNVKKKTKDEKPDYLLCGDRYFALMYEHNELVFSCILRMSSATAQRIGGRHKVRPFKLAHHDNWYKLTVDVSFNNKREVYIVLNECYDFVYENYYKGKDIGFNAEEAVAEQASIDAALANYYGLDQDVDDAAAEKAYYEALDKYKEEHFTDFKITRQEIGAEARKQKSEGVTVAERPAKPHLPASLKWKGRTFAMLYEKNDVVSMTIRIPDEYAESLIPKHPEVRRAKFPIGHNWYIVPVDGAFRNQEQLFEVINKAREFVKTANAEALAAAAKAEAKLEAKPAAKPVAAKVEKDSYELKHDSEKDDWAIYKNGGGRAIRRFDTKAEALTVAKELAENQNATLTVYKVDGTVQDI